MAIAVFLLIISVVMAIIRRSFPPELFALWAIVVALISQGLTLTVK